MSSLLILTSAKAIEYDFEKSCIQGFLARFKSCSGPRGSETSMFLGLFKKNAEVRNRFGHWMCLWSEG